MKTSHALLLLALLGVGSALAKPSSDRLVSALKQKNGASVLEELMTKGLDVNAPDSQRRLPLAEAVRARDLGFVTSLLEMGAIAKSVEPATGTTPLHAAFTSGMPSIARMLLQHGADVNAKDRSGAPARKLATSKDMAELVTLYDTKGPLAFEAAPGTWHREAREGQTYFWAPATGENRWTAPPSCAWRRFTVQGHPIKYVNSVTGQETSSVPPALAWSKVRTAAGEELWYNWAARVSASEVPAELPTDMAAELERSVNMRWYNPATREYTFTDPAYSTQWRELKDEATETPFYFNVENGETVWEVPAELAWTQVNATEDGATTPFFHNVRTGAVAWEAPEGPLSFVLHNSDL